MGKTIVKAIAWIFAFWMLAMALAGPEDPFLYRPIWAGYGLLVMGFLVIWDERNDRFRLPSRWPAGIILALPIGFVLFTLTQIQWDSRDWWLKLGLALNPLMLYLSALLRARSKQHPKAL